MPGDPDSQVTTLIRDSNHGSVAAAGVAPLRPRFFVVRSGPEKILVPLIAVDELPSYLRLKGVPSTLDAKTINDWNMARVGDTTKHLGLFEVFIRTNNPQTTSSLTSNNQTNPITELPTAVEKVEIKPLEALLTTRNVNAKGSGPSWAPLEALRNPAQVKDNLSYIECKTANLCKATLDDVTERVLWEHENDPSKTKDAMTPGVYGKKRYCTHWIRTGNCDYMQEGCKYLHVIPDEETCLQIGIRDPPLWNKEELATPAPIKSPPHGRSRTGGSAKSWRRTEVPAQNLARMSVKSGIPAISTPTSPAPHPAQSTKYHTKSTNNHSQAQSTKRPLSNSATSSLRSSKIHANPASHHTQDARRAPSVSTNESFRRQVANNAQPVIAQNPDGSMFPDNGMRAAPSNSLGTNSEGKLQNTVSGIGNLAARGFGNGSHSGYESASGSVISNATTTGLQTPPMNPQSIGSTPPLRQPLSPHPVHNSNSVVGVVQGLGQQIYLPQSPMSPRHHTGFVRQPPNYTPLERSPLTSDRESHSAQGSVGSYPPALLPAAPIRPLYTVEGSQHYGVIGSERSTNNTLYPSPSATSIAAQYKATPELPKHRRLFVNPGEEEYVTSYPEPDRTKQASKSKKKSGVPKGPRKKTVEGTQSVNKSQNIQDDFISLIDLGASADDHA